MAYLSIDEFKTIHQDWKQSGLSVREYCNNIGMRESKFYYWKQKLNAEQDACSCGTFMPVKLHSGMRGRLETDAYNSGNSALCEVVYPNGVTVRVTSDMTLDQLRQMITLFH